MTTAAAKGYYSCTECARSYSRIDHLARHVRSHMQEKPFECQVCKKCFGRPDLLKRHLLNHSETPPGVKKLKRHHNQTSRVRSACKACASAKLKCEETKPCRRCRHKNITCESSADHDGRPASNDGADDVRLASSHSTTHNDGERPHDQYAIEDSSPAYSEVPRNVPGPSTISDIDSMSNVHTGEESFFSDFLRDVLKPVPVDSYAAGLPNAPDQGAAYRDILDFANAESLPSVDDGFAFLYSIDEPRFLQGTADADIDQAPDMPQSDSRSDPEQRAGLGSEAYKQSLFSRWRPSAHESSNDERSHLVLKDVNLRSFYNPAVARFSVDRLGQASRDKILAMVLEIYKGPGAAPIVTSFPSAELFDNLLQRYLQHHNAQVDSWIHIPTLLVREQRAELLGIMVAAGSISSGIRPLQQLGYALQEVIRIALHKRCEENNACGRELGIYQAGIQETELGIWSGKRRKIEIAESQHQILITMLRRSERFHRQRVAPELPRASDQDEVLAAKWRGWAYYESMKRVTIQTFLQDSRTSIALGTPPVVSYAELGLLLPCARGLWLAKSAEEWKQGFLRDETVDMYMIPPSASKCILQPTIITRYQHRCDVHLSGLVVLHGIYGMVWEYTQMQTLVKNRGHESPDGDCLGMGFRHRNILHILEQFRASMSTWREQPSAEVRLLLELLSLYLHISLDEIQLFAGKEDKEEARSALPSLLKWVDGRTARQALWHAGQVLRAARSMAYTQLRDFYAIAVYHASLAFWAYGLLSHARTSRHSLTDTTGDAHSQTFAALDQADSAAIQHFIATGQGVPHITSHFKQSSVVLLSSPREVMEVMVDVIEQNWRQGQLGDPPLPMLVNLIHLMRELGVAAGQVQG